MMTIVQYKTKTRDDFLKDVVGQLVSLRHRKGLTQEELNYKICVADRLVSKWECGLLTPTSFNLYCWADALDGKLRIVENPERPAKSKSEQMGVLKDNTVKYYTPANMNSCLKIAA